MPVISINCVERTMMMSSIYHRAYRVHPRRMSCCHSTSLRAACNSPHRNARAAPRGGISSIVRLHSSNCNTSSHSYVTTLTMSRKLSSRGCTNGIQRGSRQMNTSSKPPSPASKPSEGGVVSTTSAESTTVAKPTARQLMMHAIQSAVPMIGELIHCCLHCCSCTELTHFVLVHLTKLTTYHLHSQDSASWIIP
jgi:hypothetical protein